MPALRQREDELSDNTVRLADFTRITAAQVQDFAEGTLQAWFQDYTPVTDDIPVQYRVRLLEDGTYQLTPMEYSADGYRTRPPQRFRISVIVEEIGA